MKINSIKMKLLSAEKGLTVKALADRAGLSPGTVVKARAGKEVTEKALVRIADALEIDALELLEASGKETG